MLPRNVKRWRQRRNTMSATISAQARSTVTAQPEPTRSMASMTSVSQSVRSRRSAGGSAESTRSVTRRDRVGVEREDGPDERASADATSQPVPVSPMLPGSGGAAPDGRRRRRSAAPGGPADRARGRRCRRRPGGRSARSVVIATLRAEPGGRDRAAADSPCGHLRVQVAEARRWSAAPTPRRRGSTRRRPEVVDDLGAHERRDVLGRLQAAVVAQLDQARRRRWRDRS